MIFKVNFFDKFFQEYHQSVIHLDPDQARHFVGPDLGPNCLQKLVGKVFIAYRISVKLLSTLFPETDRTLFMSWTYLLYGTQTVILSTAVSIDLFWHPICRVLA